MAAPWSSRVGVRDRQRQRGDAELGDVGDADTRRGSRAGADAGYIVTIKNTGKSNISQVFLTDALANANGTLADPARDPRHHICRPRARDRAIRQATRLDCALGAIRAGRSATVVVAFSTERNAILQRVFEANTTGVAGDNPGSSHGDVLQGSARRRPAPVPTSPGRFIKDDVLIVQDSAALSTGEPPVDEGHRPEGSDRGQRRRRRRDDRRSPARRRSRAHRKLPRSTSTTGRSSTAASPPRSVPTSSPDRFERSITSSTRRTAARPVRCSRPARRTARRPPTRSRASASATCRVGTSSSQLWLKENGKIRF